MFFLSRKAETQLTSLGHSVIFKHIPDKKKNERNKNNIDCYMKRVTSW